MRDQEIIGLWEAYQQVHAQPEEVEQLDEGMDMKTFKANRKKNERQADSADAKKRGHVDRFTGKPYGTKEAASRRKDIHTDRYSPERAARHRANVDPDFEGNDERNYPGGKLKNPKKIRKAKTLGELGEGVDLFDYLLEYLVAEGYADTNKAALAIMANMSEEWKQSIVEEIGIVGPPKKAIDAIPGVRNLRIAAANAVKASDYPAGQDVRMAGKHVIPTERSTPSIAKTRPYTRSEINQGVLTGSGKRSVGFKDISGDK